MRKKLHRLYFKGKSLRNPGKKNYLKKKVSPHPIFYRRRLFSLPERRRTNRGGLAGRTWHWLRCNAPRSNSERKKLSPIYDHQKTRSQRAPSDQQRTKVKKKLNIYFGEHWLSKITSNACISYWLEFKWFLGQDIFQTENILLKILQEVFPPKSFGVSKNKLTIHYFFSQASFRIWLA